MSDTSIRTPAWGGVTPPTLKIQKTTNFNSHPRVGGDEERLVVRKIVVHFNSHPRVGGDLRNAVHRQAFKISIRTPAWGVTRLERMRLSRSLFQFAPPRGGVTSRPSCARQLRYFNSHPRVGGDDIRKRNERRTRFQFAPPRGG